ncbi:MAG: hypothetical protein NT076_02615 [Candidatus Pacearchaeota archaeon]|nr:hypothetical protein [Candidatus Pacearchaeota archaeon]
MRRTRRNKMLAGGLVCILASLWPLGSGLYRQFHPLTIEERKEWATVARDNETGKEIYDNDVLMDEDTGAIPFVLGGLGLGAGLGLIVYPVCRAYKRAEIRFIRRGNNRKLVPYDN